MSVLEQRLVKAECAAAGSEHLGTDASRLNKLAAAVDRWDSVGELFAEVVLEVRCLGAQGRCAMM